MRVQPVAYLHSESEQGAKINTLIDVLIKLEGSIQKCIYKTLVLYFLQNCACTVDGCRRNAAETD